jgi:ferric-dicitrate binding protein FerR (iron transport regulator)
VTPTNSNGGVGLELPGEAVRAAARQWAARHDGGLTDAEQAEFHRWLQESSLHEVAWEEASGIWQSLDRLTVHHAIVRLGKPKPVFRWWWPAVGTAAAALIFGWMVLNRGGDGERAGALPPVPRPEVKALPQANPAGVDAPAKASARPPQPRPASAANFSMVEARGSIQRLSDGSTVYLKPGAQFVERFTPQFRSVDLVVGEAMFDVVGGADERLFVISAGDLKRNVAVTIATRSALLSVDIQSDVVETRVVTGQATIGPSQMAQAATRLGLESKGTITEAGLIARVQYPSNIDSEAHVMPLGAAEYAEILAWKRTLETTLHQKVSDAR